MTCFVEKIFLLMQEVTFRFLFDAIRDESEMQLNASD